MFLGDLIINYDSKRIPLSSKQRENLKKIYPYYGAQGVIDYVDGYIFDGEHMLIAEDGENLRSRKLPIATIVSGQFWVNNHAHIVTANESSNLLFLCYWLNNNDISEYITGSAQPKLSQSNLNAIPFPDISKDIQDTIALILLDFENKITTNLNEVEVLLQSVKTVYKNWFNNYNYLNATDELEDGIPIGWRYIPMDCAVERRTQKNNPIQTEVTITISSKDGITSDYYTKRVASKDLSKYTIVENGDFVYNRSASAGYPVGVIRRLDEYDMVALSPIYLCLRARDGILASYLSYYFDSIRFTNALYQIVGIGSRGHGMLNFNIKDFMAIEILVPPMALQLEFEQIARPIEQKIALLKEENAVLAEIRDTLLPKLMSGELPVEVGE